MHGWLRWRERDRTHRKNRHAARRPRRCGRRSRQAAALTSAVAGQLEPLHRSGDRGGIFYWTQRARKNSSGPSAATPATATAKCPALNSGPEQYSSENARRRMRIGAIYFRRETHISSISLFLKENVERSKTIGLSIIRHFTSCLTLTAPPSTALRACRSRS